MKKYSLIALAILSMACSKSIEKNNGQPEGLPQEKVESQADLIKKATNMALTSVVLDENNHSFGDIQAGDVLKHTYKIKNTGDKPLVISDVKPACGCTATDFTKNPVLPGQSAEVSLTFDSKGKIGMVNKSAEVYANVNNTPIQISFSAFINKKNK
jgi:Protein of unknown function (DUF1573)